MLTEMRFPPLQPIIVIHPSSNMKDFYPLWRKYSNSFFLLCGMYLADNEVFQWDGSGTQTTVEPAWLKIQWEADLSGLDYGIRLFDWNEEYEDKIECKKKINKSSYRLRNLKN